jgi:hypothetical protein
MQCRGGDNPSTLEDGAMAFQVDAREQTVHAGQPSRSWKPTTEHKRRRRDNATVPSACGIDWIAVQGIIVPPTEREMPNCVARCKRVELRQSARSTDFGA